MEGYNYGRIKWVGAPTKETVGKVGDIYIDTNTDKKYKCVLSYSHKDSYTIKHRLIADEGMTLTNGEIVASCIDVDSVDGWSEITDETEEVVEESK